MIHTWGDGGHAGLNSDGALETVKTTPLRYEIHTCKHAYMSFWNQSLLHGVITIGIHTCVDIVIANYS